MKTLSLLCVGILFLMSCKQEKLTETQITKKESQLIKVKKATSNILIDGIANEKTWESADWHPLNQLWLGDSLEDSDFKGRYKLSWTNEALYLLVEIQDDTLFDQHPDPLTAWWDDDCLEIFIDEDNSGGTHQFNHNAFAYHVALDGNVVDMSTEKVGKLFNSDLLSARKTVENISIWEVKLFLFDDAYDEKRQNSPVRLKRNKKVGFALAYCDNDGSTNREHFIGSLPVDGDDKNRGWIDADIFGTLLHEN